MTSTSLEELLGMIKAWLTLSTGRRTMHKNLTGRNPSFGGQHEKDLATSAANTTSTTPGLRLPPVNFPVFKGDPRQA